MATAEDEWDFETEPRWICQECGHVDYKKPLPKNLEKFRKDPRAAKCPKCGSQAFMPEGI